MRIKELREQKNITQKELASILHLTDKSICAYEKNIAHPKIETLIDMANYFGCSIDYLIGREDEYGMIILQDKNNQINSLSENERKLLQKFAKLNKFQQERVFGYLDNMLSDSNATLTMHKYS